MEVIGHRGSPNYMPENTLESFAVGMYSGANFIELDVQITKDHQVIVIHDPYLSRVTDIENFQEFAKRKSTRSYKNKVILDYFVDEFTLEELQKLKVYQKLVNTRPMIFDGKFKLPTLDQVITYMTEENSQRKSKDPNYSPVGIFLELKDGDMYRKIYGEDFEMAKFVFDVLQKKNVSSKNNANQICPIVLISFDSQSLKFLRNQTDLIMSQLVNSEDMKKMAFEEISQYADAIGPEFKMLIKSVKEGNIEFSDFADEAIEHKLMIQPWVIRDDNMEVNISSEELYIQLFTKGKINGITTEFPEKAKAILEVLKIKQKLNLQD